MLQVHSWTQSQREEASGAALWEMTAAHISPCCGSSSSNPAFSIPVLAPAETQEQRDGPGSNRPCGFAECLSQDSGVRIPSSAMDSLRASHKPATHKAIAELGFHLDTKIISSTKTACSSH